MVELAVYPGGTAGPRASCTSEGAFLKLVRLALATVLLVFVPGFLSAQNPSAAAESPQAKVYETYLKAVAAKDAKALKTILIPSIAKQIDEDKNVAKSLESLKQRAPKKVQYLRVEEDKNAATLYCDSETMTGTVTMEKVEGRWRIGLQMWKSKQ
ncbi:MAG: hypothetical protein DIJKHBIC_04076 [Thermoanaerobaculia bacterium]|nr:hypothetical protein [Thermoanaerobaculia bacterium]